jgi:hypothetical protein
VSESQPPRFRRPQSDEIEFDFQWEVSRQTEGEQQFVVLKLTNADGDFVKVGFRPPMSAEDLGSALIEGSGHGSGTAS